MVEEKTESRELNLRQLLPWTEIFRTFWIAFDLKKLILAAAGIITMSVAWWLLSLVFSFRAPTVADYPLASYTKKYGDRAEQERLADQKDDEAKYFVNKEAVEKLSRMPWNE